MNVTDREEWQELDQGVIPHSDAQARLFDAVRAPEAQPAHFAIVISNALGSAFWPSCRCGWKGGKYSARTQAWPPPMELVRAAHRRAEVEAAAHNSETGEVKAS